jgi:hypothetical protein
VSAVIILAQDYISMYSHPKALLVLAASPDLQSLVLLLLILAVAGP